MPKQSDSTADFTSTTIFEAQKNILKGKYCFEEEKKILLPTTTVGKIKFAMVETKLNKSALVV